MALPPPYHTASSTVTKSNMGEHKRATLVLCDHSTTNVPRGPGSLMHSVHDCAQDSPTVDPVVDLVPIVCNGVSPVWPVEPSESYPSLPSRFIRLLEPGRFIRLLEPGRFIRLLEPGRA